MSDQPARDYEAHHKIDSHEKVCTERYQNLWAAIQDLKAVAAAQNSDIKVTMASHNTTNDLRLTAIANRMWSLMAVVAGGAIVGLGVLAFFLLTNRPHP